MSHNYQYHNSFHNTNCPSSLSRLPFVVSLAHQAETVSRYLRPIFHSRWTSSHACFWTYRRSYALQLLDVPSQFASTLPYDCPLTHTLPTAYRTFMDKPVIPPPRRSARGAAPPADANAAKKTKTTASRAASKASDTTTTTVPATKTRRRKQNNAAASASTVVPYGPLGIAKSTRKTRNKGKGKDLKEPSCSPLPVESEDAPEEATS